MTVINSELHANPITAVISTCRSSNYS